MAGSAVLLSSRPGLGLEDPRGHLMKVLALAPQVFGLDLGLERKVLTVALVRPSPRTRPSHQDQAM